MSAETNRGQEILDWITALVNDLGPRRPGSTAEAQAAERIASSLRESCDEVRIEPVASRHGSFFGLLRLAAAGYSAAFVLTFFLPGLAFAMSLLLVSCLHLTARGRRVLDPLFSRTQTQNVAGVIHSARERKRIVLFAGHHDSPLLMPLWRPERKQWLPLIFRVSWGGAILQVLFSLSVSLAWPTWLHTVLGTGSLAGLVATLTLTWGVLGWGKPGFGANDNLSSVGVVVGLSRLLKRERPKNTEVWFLSFGCEEEGYYGSRDFAARYAPQFEKATVVNMEAVGAGELAIISREEMAGRSSDLSAIALVAAAARQAGFHLPLVKLPFAGTDAVSFAEEGIAAVTLFGRDSSGLFSLWHVEEDQPSNLRPECLEKALQVCRSAVTISDSEAARRGL